MKHNFFKSFLTLATGSLLLAGTGCNKLEDFGNTNVNPLGSTTPITAALLTGAENAAGGLAASTTPAVLYAQYVAETQYTDASLYSEPKIEFGGNYSGAMYDLQSIINRNTDPAQASGNLGSGSNANQIAVAKILLAYNISVITDRWGDVPFTQALQGGSNVSPVYDDQLVIYKKMLTDLKESIALFDGGLPVQGDIIYGGDQAKWKKFANSLRMRLSLRLSKKFPGAGEFAATEFAAAASDPAGFIATNLDNCKVPYPGGAVYKHPWFITYDGRSDYALSKTFDDILGNMADNRRNAYGSPGSSFPYGLTRADATTLPTNYSKVLSANNRQDNSPVFIFSAASSLLNVAEGLERGWITATVNPVYTSAATAYTDGIQASFVQWGIAGGAGYSTGTAANYNTGTGGGNNIGANPFGSIVGSDAITNTKLERIALQSYIAYFPDGTQAWSEWRRTGIPHLKPTTFATNSTAGKQIPTRYVYGVNEYSLNPANVAEAASKLVLGDVMNARVWWDTP